MNFAFPLDVLNVEIVIIPFQGEENYAVFSSSSTRKTKSQ